MLAKIKPWVAISDPGQRKCIPGLVFMFADTFEDLPWVDEVATLPELLQ